jgi:acyl dehydratase
MTLNYDGLLARKFPDVAHRYTPRDTILYALGCGYGVDPTDTGQLRYIYEEGLQVAPTMATVLGHPGFWIKEPDTGVDWKKVVHGTQSLTIHRPLQPSGDLIGRTRVTRIVDKGPKVGALVYSERSVIDRADSRPVCTLSQVTVCRGDGGFGGPTGVREERRTMPARAPDFTVDLPTTTQAALIYRLSGDLNPLHADPAVARTAGYDRPILHGLATFGVAGHALLRACCNYEAAQLRRMEGRFTAPVFPGENVRTEIWSEASKTVQFCCRVPGRDRAVISDGYAEFAV